MAFIDERFPTVYSYDPDGGPSFSVLINQSEGGQEARSPSWYGLDQDFGLAEFELAERYMDGRWGMQNGGWPATARGDFNALRDFFITVAQGKANGFRFNYWWDNYASRALLVNTVTGGFTGDGTTATFQLSKQYYSPGGTASVNKKIFKQLGTHNTTVTEYLNINQTGIPNIQQVTTAPLIYASAAGSTPIGNSHYTIDNLGLVTFLSGFIPGAGVSPTASFYFDYPVRFDVDKPPLKYTMGVFSLDTIQLVELRNAI